MKELRVISRECLPTRLPIVGTVVWWLLMERVNAPGWLWGALGFGMVLVWIAAFVRIFKEKRTKLPGFGEE